jgi:UDP-N-acetylmuramate--alanine ligase
MFKKIQHIHFIGIGGIGMSGIAEVLLNLGYRVSGSDVRETEITRRLAGLGGKIYQGHQKEHIQGANVVVVSSAVKGGNPEVDAAREATIPVIPRAEMLAELMRLKYGVAVAGMHGKTTTTSMVATLLGVGGLDPTVVIGGKLNIYGSNAKLGQGDFLVAEADESDGSFLSLSPAIAVITNIDREHLDYYRDLDHIKEAFLIFMNKVPFYGVTILCLDDPYLPSLIPALKKRYLTYGLSSQADLQAREVVYEGEGSRYRVFYRGAELGEVNLPLPGQHNVLNSLGAAAVGLELDLPFGVIKEAFSQFRGVERRFEVKGERGGVLVLDDYGHHPTEIRAVLDTVKRVWPKRRVVVAFQPHRYTRTQALMEEFLAAFYQADLLLVTEIYAAGESPIPGVEGQVLAEAIRRRGHREVHFIGNKSQWRDHLKGLLKDGDLFLTLGAGNIWELGTGWLKGEGC